jgi:predicted neutral ceramidase superfamily lipid hydrolase
MNIIAIILVAILVISFFLSLKNSHFLKIMAIFCVLGFVVLATSPTNHAKFRRGILIEKIKK